MIYVNIKTNKVVGLNTIRRENRNISIPKDADCTDFGYKKLVLVDRPVKAGFIAIEKDPIDFTQTWELIVDTTIEAERVASIWEQIEEQEKLAMRAILNDDTVWIQKRKDEINRLKGTL